MPVVKDNERVYLDLLLAALPELHGVAVREHESPDFLLDCASGTIGVEVTRYASSDSQGLSSTHQRSSLRERVVAVARSHYEERGGPPLFVDL
jgi:hypothetical protein